LEKIKPYIEKENQNNNSSYIQTKGDKGVRITGE
jgi:hypothetical protein